MLVCRKRSLQLRWVLVLHYVLRRIYNTARRQDLKTAEGARGLPALISRDACRRKLLQPLSCQGLGAQISSGEDPRKKLTTPLPCRMRHDALPALNDTRSNAEVFL